MNMQTIRLMDSSAHEIATAQVTPEGEHYGGIMDLRALPPSMRALFEELEEIVNGQMLSFLDDIEAKIAALGIKAVFADSSEAEVRDLQVYPSTGDISFKLASAPVYNGVPAPGTGRARV